MKKPTRALLLAVSALLLPQAVRADGWGYLYGAVKLTTDYRFHGFSESNRRPAAQGNLHWVAPDDWFLGVFASQVNFLDGSTDYEVDWYGGKHIRFGNNDLKLQVLYYTFPNHAGPFPGYNAIQGSAELIHDFGALTLAPKVQVKHGHAGQGWQAELSVSTELTSWLIAHGNTGYQDGAKSFGRLNWEAGLAAKWESLEFDVRYSGVNTPKSRCYFTNWCASGFSATVTYSFGWVL